MTRVTHAQAYAALADPEVPIEKAIRLFEQAHKRSNEATRHFVLHAAGLARKAWRKAEAAA